MGKHYQAWFDHAVVPAFTTYMSHPKRNIRAMVQIVATALQESTCRFRKQVPTGPARSYLQIETPTAMAAYRKDKYLGAELMNLNLSMTTLQKTGREAMLASAYMAQVVELNDIAAVLVGRAIMWLDPHPLPALGDHAGAWKFYNEFTWRPGKPHPELWPENYLEATEIVLLWAVANPSRAEEFKFTKDDLTLMRRYVIPYTGE